MAVDSTPNCVITLYYYRGNEPVQPPSFTFHCTNRSQGWQVETNGSIFPPSQKRVIQFRLDVFPSDRDKPAKFAGFRIANLESFQLTEDNWTSRDILKDLGVEPGDNYPSTADDYRNWRTEGPLIFDLTNAESRLAYCLAVGVEGSEPDWDDPKIYDDGSQ